MESMLCCQLGSSKGIRRIKKMYPFLSQILFQNRCKKKVEGGGEVD